MIFDGIIDVYIIDVVENLGLSKQNKIPVVVFEMNETFR